MSTPGRTPLTLDTSVLRAVARGDADIIALVQEYDARGQPIVIPALAIAGASLDIRNEEGDDLLAGLELLEVVTVAHCEPHAVVSFTTAPIPSRLLLCPVR